MNLDGELRLLLGRIPPYSSLSDEELDRLISASRMVPVAAHEVLVDEGDVVETVFVLTKGHMKRHLIIEQGRRMLLNDTHAPASFALAAPHARTPHVGRVEAVVDSEVLAVPVEAFDALLAGNAGFAREVVGILARSSARQTATLLELMYPVPVRLARFVLRSTRDGICDLGPTRTDVAERLGTVPETLSRAIATLCKQGLVRRDGSKLRVADEKALRRYAQM